MKPKVGITSELRVVDYNPEMADMDNPKGAITGEVFFLAAEYPDGKVEAHYFGSADKTLIEDLEVRVAKHLANGGELNEDHWLPWRITYGSPAWSGAEEAAMERKEAEVK